MSWSLQLRNGDLALGGTSFGQTTGGNKLVQDLRCALLEHRGHDDMHASFGSLLDGGLDDFGIEQPSLIGTSDWARIALRVEAEIRRITQEHQQRQLERAKQDRYTYGESTLSGSELLLQVSDIRMMQAQDALMVSVSLITGTGQAVVINTPITNGTVVTT